MKKMMSMILALVMAFTVISPSVLAVEATDASGENLVFTTTETVSMKDENGQWVVLESRTNEALAGEVTFAQPLTAPNGIVPLSVSYAEYRKNADFENGAVQLSLNARFEYEPGNYVECVSKTGSITKNAYGWIIISKTFSTSKNALGTRASATMDVVLKTTANKYREYSVTVTCTRDGNIS